MPSLPPGTVIALIYKSNKMHLEAEKMKRKATCQFGLVAVCVFVMFGTSCGTSPTPEMPAANENCAFDDALQTFDRCKLTP
jgi:hypothetical protein